MPRGHKLLLAGGGGERTVRGVKRCTARRAMTLVEMIVVLLILAILIALSLFAGRSFLHRGYDLDAHSRMQEVAQAQLSLYGKFGAYSESREDFRSLPGETVVTHIAATEPGQVSAAASSTGWLGLATRSASGKCLYVQVAPLIQDGAVHDIDGVPSSAPCHGSEALPDDAPWVQQPTPQRVSPLATS